MLKRRNKSKKNLKPEIESMRVHFFPCNCTTTITYRFNYNTFWVRIIVCHTRRHCVNWNSNHGLQGLRHAHIRARTVVWQKKQKVNEGGERERERERENNVKTEEKQLKIKKEKKTHISNWFEEKSKNIICCCNRTVIELYISRSQRSEL